MDLFLDEVQAMAWHNPLRFMGLLMLVVAGAAFLALVRACFVCLQMHLCVYCYVLLSFVCVLVSAKNTEERKEHDHIGEYSHMPPHTHTRSNCG